MPPSHWVRLRQSRMLALSCSMSVRIEAPVVVKPEADSNSAAIGSVISPLST